MALFYFCLVPAILVLGLVFWAIVDAAPDFDSLFGQFVLTPLAICCIIRARRLLAGSANQKLKTDHRPPVLYLRAFVHDGKAPIGTVTPRTEESRITSELGRIGPVVAIGRPGESISHLGASRLYVSDSQWKEVAFELMAGARLILMRLAETDGVRWELGTLKTHVNPEKLVLWIQGDWKKFRALTEESLGLELPSDLHGRNFIAFDKNWNPLTLWARLGHEDTFDWFLSPLSFCNERRRWLRRLGNLLPNPPDGSVRLRTMVDALEAVARPAPPFRLPVGCWLLWFTLLAAICASGAGWLSQVLPVKAEWRTALASIEAVLVLCLAIHLAFSKFLALPERVVNLRQTPALTFCAVVALDFASIPFSQIIRH
jgi:hypothetical protein